MAEGKGDDRKRAEEKAKERGLRGRWPKGRGVGGRGERDCSKCLTIVTQAALSYHPFSHTCTFPSSHVVSKKRHYERTGSAEKH